MAHPPVERRDPFSPVLRLGSALASARSEGLSGMVEVRDRGRTHAIAMSRGAIADVLVDSGAESAAGLADRAARLFGLPRPHVVWIPFPRAGGPPGSADPAAALLGGISGRADLFDPRVLVERIPAETLCIGPERMSRIGHLPLAPEELEFLGRISVPTPIPMILWKRGLDPRRAGALLVALNLVGVWNGDWEPGALPRLTAAARILRRSDAGAPDCDLLGVPEDPEPGALDRAFRRLSLEVHPDRVALLPEAEVDLARAAFARLSAAYDRMRKRSRRSRPVRAPGGAALARVRLARREASRWEELAAEARRARGAGEIARARAFALKALALSPPEPARSELSGMLSLVA